MNLGASHPEEFSVNAVIFRIEMLSRRSHQRLRVVAQPVHRCLRKGAQLRPFPAILLAKLILLGCHVICPASKSVVEELPVSSLH
jgi:hypothetical protein